MGDHCPDLPPSQLLNVWLSDLQVCLGWVAVDRDSNEITAVPKLTLLPTWYQPMC